MADHCTLETGIYTLTATHCGTGQAAGAVDLPIARERHTGYPLIPATSIKGVVRDLAEGRRGGQGWSDEERRELLGPDSEETLSAGCLVFTDGRLLAFPVRSLQAPFLWVTCPLVIQRRNRDRRALGLEAQNLSDSPTDLPAVAGPCLGEGRLVLEDHYYPRVAWSDPAVIALAKQWQKLVPPGEGDTRAAIGRRLAVIPDKDFQDLVRRTTPVNARIQLTGGKTTDKWKNPDGNVESGNLWYEETLPSDCLISALATSRRRKRQDVEALRCLLADPNHRVIQIGGNETVGQGLCWWSPEEAGDES